MSQEYDLPTVTIHGSWVFDRADGATALVLDTVEEGAIAFVVLLLAILAPRSAASKRR